MPSSLTKITDLAPHEIEWIIKKAFEFKAERENGAPTKNILQGKVVALLFEKQSLRTRMAFEVAAGALGGQPIFLSEENILAGKKGASRESIADIAKNLERFCDLIVARVYKHSTILELAASSKKPVINALCDLHHPTQALADLMAIQWHKKNYKNLKVAFIGDGNNVATSLMHICAMIGLNFTIASPRGYEIPKEEQIRGAALADQKGTKIAFLADPKEAVQNTDVVYTDTFVSMGQEAEQEERLKVFAPYQVNKNLMQYAKKEALFMHCLPAYPGQEVTDEVISGPQSIVFDQAECRLHIAKALLAYYVQKTVIASPQAWQSPPSRN